MKSLEEALDTQLFIRKSQGISLTPAGEALLAHALRVFQQLERLHGDLQTFSRGLKGQVRIFANTTAITGVLPAVLGLFLASHPQVDVDLEERKLGLPVRALSGGQRQAVAIGRAIFWKAELLIMDEPTAALGVPEQRKVIELIRSLRRQNVAVIFISHNLVDIFAVADRILVLRRGLAAGERRPEASSHDEIVRLMVGG